MANYATLKAAIDAVIKTNGNQEITGEVLNQALNAMVNSLGANYQFAGVATPSTNPGTPDQNVFYVAMQAGTYSNFNAIVLPDGLSVLKWNGSWSADILSYGTDGVYDISAAHNNTPYIDLAAALGTGGGNIPEPLRKGGMSVKFIKGSSQSSDNKYVQYRYLSTSTDVADFVNVVNWEKEIGNKTIDQLLKIIAKKGYYYNSSVGSIVQYHSDNNYQCEEIPVLVGQKFAVAGIPSNNARLWATLDADRKVVRCSEYTSLQRQETVTIEDGEYFLSYNTNNNSTNKIFQLTDGSIVDFIVKLDDYYRATDTDIYSKINQINNKDNEQDISILSILGTLNNNTDISSFKSGTYTINSKLVVTEDIPHSGFVSMKIRVKSGIKFLLTLKGSSSIRVYYTANANNIRVRQSDLSAVLDSYELTINDGEEYLYINSTTTSFTPKIVFDKNISGTLMDSISVLSDNKESLDIISSFYPIMSDVIPQEVKTAESSFWELGSLGSDWYVGGSSTQLVNVRPIKLVKGKYQINVNGDNKARYALYDKHFNKITNDTISNTIITVSDDFNYLYIGFLASVVANIFILRLSKIKKDVKLKDSDRNEIDGLTTVSQSYADGHSIINDTTFTTADFTTESSGKVSPLIPIKKGAKIDVFSWNTTTPNSVQGIRIYKDEKYIRFISFATTSTDGCTVSKTGATHSTASEYKFHFNSDFFDADGMSIRIVNTTSYAKVPSIRVVAYENSFVLDTNDVHSDLFILGDLGSVYSRALPINVEGTAGEPNAMYSILAPITRYFNIRFKFRITDAIINSAKAQAPLWAANTSYLIGDYVWYSNKSYKCTVAHTSSSTFDSSKFTEDYINIFRGAGSYIRAIPSVGGLSQFTKTYTYSGSSHTSYYGTFNGGIAFDSIANINNRKFLNNIGDFAFSVRYVGNGSAATARNTGSAFILNVDGVEVANLAYSTYTTMSALYEAIAAITDFEVDYNEIENRTPQELAIFPESQLVSTFYGNLSGVKPTAENSEEYTDNPPLLVPYAVSNRWNQAEIVGIDDNIYVVVNGITSSFSRAQTSVAKLIFGGDCGVLFKDVEIDLSSVRDAELVNNYGLNTPMIISSVNPYTMIWEGHGMVDSIIDADNYPGDEMSCSTDRIQRVTEASMAKGYIPVSLKDIVEHYKYGKSLPKRCFTFVFDDYRFGNFLNLKNRSVFTRFNLKASLAVISGENATITYNGSVITMEKAVSIGKNAGFECYSHTRNHRYMESIRPSDYANQAWLDIYDGDEKGINPNILIFPYGNDNTYLLDVLKFIGLEAGIEVEVGNPYCNNPYSLVRQEIGVRSTIGSVLAKIV